MYTYTYIYIYNIYVCIYIYISQYSILAVGITIFYLTNKTKSHRKKAFKFDRDIHIVSVISQKTCHRTFKMVDASEKSWFV